MLQTTRDALEDSMNAEIELGGVDIICIDADNEEYVFGYTIVYCTEPPFSRTSTEYLQLVLHKRWFHCEQRRQPDSGLGAPMHKKSSLNTSPSIPQYLALSMYSFPSTLFAATASSS